jgi:tripartite-type tricarboxylate transporter receptor subunit TctC
VIICKAAKSIPVVAAASFYRHVLRTLAVAALAIATSWQPANAQDAPSKIIRIIVPYPPGAAVDVLGRMLGNVITAQTGRTVVVENRPGARSYMGAEAVARSEGDGDTLLFTVDDTFTIVPHLTKNATFEPMKQLVPINIVGTISMVMVVNPSLPVDSLEKFIAYARTNPTAISYSSAGIGSSTQLALDMLKAQAKIELLHVPYRGLTPATTAVITGEVQASVLGYSSSKAMVEAGKLKAIAIASPDRVPSLPSLPTMQELGYPRVQATPRLTFALPATTPPEVLKRTSEMISRALSDPEMRKQIEARDIIYANLGPKEAAAELDRLSKLNGEAVRVSGAVAD